MQLSPEIDWQEILEICPRLISLVEEQEELAELAETASLARRFASQLTSSKAEAERLRQKCREVHEANISFSPETLNELHPMLAKFLCAARDLVKPEFFEKFEAAQDELYFARQRRDAKIYRWSSRSEHYDTIRVAARILLVEATKHVETFGLIRKNRPSKRRGAPIQYDHKRDRQIFKVKESGAFTTYQALGRQFNISERDARLACERIRQSLTRQRQ